MHYYWFWINSFSWITISGWMNSLFVLSAFDMIFCRKLLIFNKMPSELIEIHNLISMWNIFQLESILAACFCHSGMCEHVQSYHGIVQIYQCLWWIASPIERMFITIAFIIYGHRWNPIANRCCLHQSTKSRISNEIKKKKSCHKFKNRLNIISESEPV